MKTRNYVGLLFLLLFVLTMNPSADAASKPKPLKYAFVEQVTDPYTLEVSIGRKQYTVRMLGLTPLDALKPETLLRLSDLQADKYVKSLLYNTFVYLEFDEQEKDFEDRLLAYVWLELPNPEKRDDKEIRAKMANAKLLLEGYGQWVMTMPNYKYLSYLRAFGEEAQKKHTGIWRTAK